MRNFRPISGQALAVAASLVLLAACGGGGDDAVAEDPTATTTTTTARASTTTTAVGTTTTTTVPGTVTINGAQFVNSNTASCLREGTQGFGTVGAATQNTCFTNGDPAQYWKITRYGTTNFTISSNLSNKCLAITGGSTADLAPASVVTCDGSPATMWTMPASGAAPNAYNLKNVGSGKCLEVMNTNNVPGGQVTQFTCGVAQPNQTWTRNVITP